MKNNLFIKILLSIFVIYSLLGFFLVPYIAKDQIIKNLDNLLIYKSSLKKVFFNPYTLSIELEDFSISNKNEKLIGFDELEVDFSLLKSIHESTIRFKTISLVKPYINIIQDEKGNINLASILKPQENKKENEPKSDLSIPTFKISKTQIINGNFIFTQIFNSKKTSTNINKFNYTFYDLGTFKNSLASHSLVTNINKDTKLYIDGGMRLIPFKMYGNVKLQNFHVSEYIAYSKDLLNFDIDNPTLSLNFGYKLDTNKDLKLYIDKANIQLKNLNLIKDEKKVAGVNNFQISNLNLDYTNQKIDIDNILVNKLFANIILNKNGKMNIDNLINSKNTTTQEENNNKKSKTWSIDLNSFNLNNSNLSYEDLKNKTNTNLKDIKIALNNLSIVNNNINIDVSSIGTKNLKVNDELNKTNIQAKNIEINIHNLIKDDKRIKITSINIPTPYASITLGKKEKINESITKPKKVKAKIITKEDKSSTLLDIGPVQIKDAQLIFEDKNLNIPFKTNITKLNGSFSELDTTSSKPTKLKLEGKIDKYGYTKITGLVDHKNIKNLTDINLIFKNIDMKNFTPYSDKFVGRDVKKGKLNLNLQYNITKSNLKAQNSVVIDKIELGKIIKNSTATNLPLELGIALLEDSNGIIDINLPISGNVDDPEFSVAPVIWKVFTNLIIKSVASPFSLLASLLGISEDDIKKVEFVYGESILINSEKETLDNIAKAFAKRPNLALKIQPAYDKTKDKIALQDLKLETMISKKMKNIKDGDKYLIALESLYNGNSKLKDLKKKSIIKIKDKLTLDKKTYISKIKNIMRVKIEVTKEELENLANNRIESVKKYFLKKDKINKNRLFVNPKIKILDNKTTKFVEFPLSITIKNK